MLDGLECHMQTDFLDDIGTWERVANRIVYTGAIDEFWKYCLGDLDWRSLQFASETHNGDYQGVAAVNYTSEDVVYTRIVEHKHFEFGTQDHTIITKECPVMWGPGRERYYPINNEENNELFRRYDAMVDRDKYIFGGRLARYRYFDMDQVIGMALKAASAEKN
jgi:UDP-galactopyranose mutase